MTAFATIFLLSFAIVVVLFAKRCVRTLLYLGVVALALGLLAMGWLFVLPQVLPHASSPEYFVRQFSRPGSSFDTFSLELVIALIGGAGLMVGAVILGGLIFQAAFCLLPRHLTTRSSEQAGR